MAIVDEILSNLIDFTYHPYKALYGDLKKIYRAESLRIALARAVGKGWVQKRIDKEGVFVQLTALGKERLQKSRSIRKLLPWQIEDESAKICVVVFDIPEKDRVLRNLLRAKLREAGFVGWQKSVWIGKKIDLEALREFLAEAGLADYVLAFETADTGNSKLEKALHSR